MHLLRGSRDLVNCSAETSIVLVRHNVVVKHAVDCITQLKVIMIRHALAMQLRACRLTTLLAEFSESWYVQSGCIKLQKLILCVAKASIRIFCSDFHRSHT